MGDWPNWSLCTQGEPSLSLTRIELTTLCKGKQICYYANQTWFNHLNINLHISHIQFVSDIYHIMSLFTINYSHLTAYSDMWNKSGSCRLVRSWAMKCFLETQTFSMHVRYIAQKKLSFFTKLWNPDTCYIPILSVSAT